MKEIAMEATLQDHVSQALTLAHDMVKKNPSANKGVGSVNTKGEESIELDKMLENMLISFFQKNLEGSKIFSEECGMVPSLGEGAPKYLVVFDPLDGSINYSLGLPTFPHATLIAVYRLDQNGNTCLKDVLSAGMVEHTTGHMFLYANGKTTHVDLGEVSLVKFDGLPKRVAGYDLYYKDAWRLGEALSGEIWVRDAGSQSGNLFHLLMGAYQFSGGMFVAPEEVGAVYSLVLGAGGFIGSTKGEELAEAKFDPSRKYDILLCANEEARDLALASLK